MAVNHGGFTAILSLFCGPERMRIWQYHCLILFVQRFRRSRPVFRVRAFSNITKYHLSEKSSSENPWDLATSWIILDCRWYGCVPGWQPRQPAGSARPPWLQDQLVGWFGMAHALQAPSHIPPIDGIIVPYAEEYEWLIYECQYWQEWPLNLLVTGSDKITIC